MFRLHYTFDMGKNSDQRLSIAAGYLNYLGTSTQTPVQIQQAFYRLGTQLYASCNDDHFYLTLSGLEESFDEAVALMHEFLSDLQPNADALQNMVADVLQRRENNKKNKQEVLNKAMMSYAMYGHRSPMKDRLSKAQLLALEPQEITDLLRNLLTFKHEAFYYGNRSTRAIGSILKNAHPVTKQGISLQKVLKNKKYKEIATTKDKVVFVHFPTVQVELMLVSKGTPFFNLEEYVMSEWYNQYFGYGLSSIVFQEIRESKALAYSAYAVASNPSKKDNAHFLRAYVGTQPDKLRDAVDAFRNIMEDMPVSIPQMESARLSVIKQIAAGRIINADIYWNWRSNIQKGFKNKDLREEIFRAMEKTSPESLVEYHKNHLKGRKYTWLVLGDRERVDFKFLKKMGKVEELSIEEAFGY
jgi:predicted Zn-dependent peptidase